LYNGTWSTAQLQQGRFGIAAVTIGTKAIFAGGFSESGASDMVDIFDSATGKWSSTLLSARRYGITAVSTNDGKFALFVGGTHSEPTKIVDVYDLADNSWTAFNLPESDGLSGASGATVGINGLISGGQSYSGGLVKFVYVLNCTSSPSTTTHASTSSTSTTTSTTSTSSSSTSSSTTKTGGLSTSTTSGQVSPGDEGGLSGGKIAAIVIVVLLVALAAALLTGYLLKTRIRRRLGYQELTENQLSSHPNDRLL